MSTRKLTRRELEAIFSQPALLVDQAMLHLTQQEGVSLARLSFAESGPEDIGPQVRGAFVMTTQTLAALRDLIVDKIGPGTTAPKAH